jgi:PAS domain S-box-containing protein
MSDIEYKVPLHTAIVSKTDLSGMITYANDAFITISGFSREELIGKPHNLVRHPDMPAAAFADLWATVEQNKPWRGLVKNRTKDGGFYWVQATIVPVRKAGKVVGYMSVRYAASDAQVKEAKRVYAQPKVKLAKPGYLKRLLSIKSGYIAGSLFVIALLITGGMLGIGTIRHSTGQINKADAQYLRKLDTISQLEIDAIRAQTAPAEQRQARIAQLAKHYAANPHTPADMRDRLKGLDALNNAARLARSTALDASLGQQIHTLVQIAAQNRQQILRQSAREVGRINQGNAQIVDISLLGIVLGIVTVVAFGMVFMRQIVRPLDSAIENFEKIAEGDLTGDVPLDGAGETGHLLRSSVIMQMHLKVVMDELNLLAGQIDTACLSLNTALFEISDHSEVQHDKLEEAKSFMSLDFIYELSNQLTLLETLLADSAVPPETRDCLASITNLNRLQTFALEDFLDKIDLILKLIVSNRQDTQEAYAMSAKLHEVAQTLNSLVNYFVPDGKKYNA